MTIRVAISPDEERIVRAVLLRHLPEGTRVYVFGSRATLGAKPHSDLDLLVEAAEPLALSTIAKIREAFDESLLPWKIDLVDRFTVSEAFGKIIDAQKIPFPLD